MSKRLAIGVNFSYRFEITGVNSFALRRQKLEKYQNDRVDFN
jgi:hypothetical protein